ncbi:MAG: NfeD family protein [Eubacterium sp.]|nr:NfeD family protein [Eubacterium sp.]
MADLLQLWTAYGSASWVVLMVVLLVIEVITMGLTTIWFAGGCLGGFIVSLLGGPMWLQFVVFAVLSLVLLIFTRPVAVKYYNSRRIKTNADYLVGQSAVIIEGIDNLSGKGKAMINGMEWTARSVLDDERIPEGTIVTVKEIQGVKLIVEEMKQ